MKTGDPVRDKIILVTGAGRGIGRAAARLLAERGARVVLVARDRRALESAALEIESRRGLCTVLPGDVSSEESVRNFIHSTFSVHGRIDVLVNNAGACSYGPVASASAGVFDTVVGTNLKGVFLCSREVIPVMTRQGGGRIVNVASGAGKYGFPNMAVYCASKFGVIGFTEALARELAPLNISVSCICPGYVRTELLNVLPKTLLKESAIKEPDEIARQIHDLIASGMAPKKRIFRLRSITRKDAYA